MHPIHGMPPSSAVNLNPLSSVGLGPAEALSACSVLLSFMKNIFLSTSMMWFICGSSLVPQILQIWMSGGVKILNSAIGVRP